MLSIRTAAESRTEGLRVPTWVPNDEYLLVHDPDDGNLLAWGPAHLRHEVEANAKMFA